MVVIHCCALLIKPACQVKVCLATRFDAVSCLSEKWNVKLFWTSTELITYVLSGISELSLKHKGKHHEPGQSPAAVKLWSCSFCQTVKPEQGQDSANRRPASLQEHTTSQCLLLAEKHFVLSFNQSIALLLPHISLFHTITNSTRRERRKSLSLLPTVNISFMVYTVKLLSCKSHKLSSQNVHITQLNVVFFMSSDVSVRVWWSVRWRVCTVQV